MEFAATSKCCNRDNHNTFAMWMHCQAASCHFCTADAPCLQNDIRNQWCCSVVLCMPMLASAADALLHTATAVLFLWQQVLVPASTGTSRVSHISLGWLVALHHHQDSDTVQPANTCQYVMAPSRRLQPLCQQQDKRSDVGQGTGILNFIRSASCSRYAQSGFKLQYTAC